MFESNNHCSSNEGDGVFEKPRHRASLLVKGQEWDISNLLGGEEANGGACFTPSAGNRKTAPPPPSPAATAAATTPSNTNNRKTFYTRKQHEGGAGLSESLYPKEFDLMVGDGDVDAIFLQSRPQHFKQPRRNTTYEARNGHFQQPQRTPSGRRASLDMPRRNSMGRRNSLGYENSNYSNPASYYHNKPDHRTVHSNNVNHNKSSSNNNNHQNHHKNAPPTNTTERRSSISSMKDFSSSSSVVGAHASCEGRQVAKLPPPSFSASYERVERKVAAAHRRRSNEREEQQQQPPQQQQQHYQQQEERLDDASMMGAVGGNHNHYQNNNNDERPQIEVSPGVFMPLRGSKETMEAMKRGQALYVQCIFCNVQLCCIQDAEMVICPDCRVLSPVTSPTTAFERLNGYQSSSSSTKNKTHRGIGGVGLGMKTEHIGFFDA